MDWHLMIMQRIERMATTPTVDGDEIKSQADVSPPAVQPAKKRSRRSLLKTYGDVPDSIVL
jgi:hypothetical protein